MDCFLFTIDINWNDPDEASKQIAVLQKQIEDWNAKGVNVQDPVYKIIDQYLKNDEISKYIDELNTNLASLDQSFLQEADYAVGGLDNALDFKDFKDKVEKFKEELKDNINWLESPLYLNSKFYDRYIEIKLPSAQDIAINKRNIDYIYRYNLLLRMYRLWREYRGTYLYHCLLTLC